MKVYTESRIPYLRSGTGISFSMAHAAAAASTRNESSRVKDLIPGTRSVKYFARVLGFGHDRDRRWSGVVIPPSRRPADPHKCLGSDGDRRAGDKQARHQSPDILHSCRPQIARFKSGATGAWEVISRKATRGRENRSKRRREIKWKRDKEVGREKKKEKPQNIRS